jgi:hypothetical protein
MGRRKTLLERIQGTRADIAKHDTDSGQHQDCSGTVMLVAVRVNPNRLHQGSFRELGVTNCHVAFRDAARIRSDGQSSMSSQNMNAANRNYYQIKN